MNFSEKVAEIEEKHNSYKLKIESGKKVSDDKMLRIMLESGQMLEPCIILGESDEYIDFLVIDIEDGPVFSISINKEKIVGFGAFNKPFEELTFSEEETNAVPASLYM